MSGNQDNRTREERDELFEVMLKYAVREDAREEYAAQEREFEKMEDPVYSERFKKGMEKIFADARKQERRRKRRERGSRFLHRAAVLLITAGVISGIAFFPVDAVKVSLYNLFAGFRGGQVTTDIVLGDDVKEIIQQLPDSWEGAFVLPKVQDGFTLTRAQSNDFALQMIYTDGENHIVIKERRVDNLNLGINADTVEPCMVNDIEGTAYIQERAVSIVWRDKRIWLEVQTDTNYETAKNIARNLVYQKRL